MEDSNGTLLKRLEEQAREYVKNDSNASMIKQGMMLELVCREYVEIRGDLETIRRRKEDAILRQGRRLVHHVDINLEDLIGHLKKALMIYPEDSDTDRIVTKVRINRNKAVHDFFDSQQEAMSTLNPAIDFCLKLHEASLKLMTATERRHIVWENPFISQRQEGISLVREGEELDDMDDCLIAEGCQNCYTADPAAIHFRGWTMSDEDRERIGPMSDWE